MTPIEVLAECFRRLDAEKRANLLWHEQAGTPICCGETAILYTDGEGGG